jgi:protein AroM
VDTKVKGFGGKMSYKPRLGLITTGHGPRPEYSSFHGGLLHQLGVDAEVLLHYTLDGLSREEIEELAPQDKDDAIHGYIRVPGSINKKFGPGWGESWVGLGQTIRLVQKCIYDLERAGVDAIIYCCAEAYPEDAFTSTKPLVMPYRTVVNYAETVARLGKGRATIAVLTGSTRQRPQQLRMWQRYPWATELDIRYIELGKSPLNAVRNLRQVKPDLVIYWGYGVGLAPGDDPDLLSEMQSVIGQPIVLHHVVATLFVRNFLYPSIPAHEYVRRVNNV